MSAPAEESALLDFDGWLGAQPVSTRSAVQGQLSLTPEADRPLEKQRLASMFAVSKATGLDPDTVNEKWDIVRGGFAEQQGEEWYAVKDDESGFFGQLQQRAQKQRDERHALIGPDDDKAPDAKQTFENSLAYRSREAAYAGRSYADALAEWQDANKGKIEPSEKHADFAWQQWQAMQDVLAKARPAGEEAYKRMLNARDESTSATGNVAPFALFRGMTQEEKAAAFRVMEEWAGKETNKGRAQAFWESVGRGFENLVIGGGSAAFRDKLLTAQFKEGDRVSSTNAADQVAADFMSESIARSGSGSGGAGLAGVYGKSHTLTADEAAKWNEQLKGALDDLDTSEQLRKFGQDVIDPAKAGGWFFKKVVLPAADSAALMANLTIPATWAPALELGARSYQNDEYARLRDAGMNPREANNIALVTGAAQSALDKLEVSALKGFGSKFLPATTRALEQFAIGGSTGARLAANFAATAGAETLIELAQDHVVPALVQDNLTSDPAFDVHWGDVWREVGKDAPETFLGMVLLSGLGGITQTREQSQTIKELGESAAAMRLRGYSLEQIKEIQAAPTEARGQLLAEYLPAKAPEGEAKTALIADVQRLAREEKEVFDAKKAAETTASTEAADYAIRVSRTDAGWQVTKADGVTVTVDTPEAARRIREDLKQAETKKEAEALVAIIDAWHAKGEGRETTLSGEQVRSDGETISRSRDGAIVREITDEKTLQTLREEARMDANATGSQEIDVLVNGSNSLEFTESVAGAAKTMIQRLELNQSESTALTAIHEQVESTWRAGIARGTITLEETQRAVAAVAGALDPATARDENERNFRERVGRVAAGTATDTETRETVSELAVAEVIGRRKDGVSMPAGSVSAALDAAITNATNPADVKALGKFRAFLRAAKTWFRGVLGTVAAIKKARKEGQTQDFDALVDKLLGLDEQARHSNEAAAEAEAIAAESALDYVEPSAEDMANGVAFSLSRQTESPAFKKWFGNSKVTDTEGNPLMLVHVTDKAFTKFTPGGKAPRADIKAGKWSGRAIWLKLPFGEGRTEHRGNGRTEGSRTIPLFAKIEQPMIVDDDTRDFARSLYGSYFPQIMSDEAIQMLRDDNYDGVIEYEKGHKLGAPEKITEVVVFDPTQVKSAFGNRGEFDGSKADITLSVSPSSRLELVQRRVESALKRDPEKRRRAWGVRVAGEPSLLMRMAVDEGATFSLSKGMPQDNAAGRQNADASNLTSQEADVLLDSEGKPLVVFHGTTHGGFDTFSLPGERDPEYGVRAVFFTSERDVAEHFTQRSAYDRPIGSNPELITAKIRTGRVLDFSAPLSSLSDEDASNVAAVYGKDLDDARYWAEEREENGKSATVSNFLYQGGATELQDLDTSTLDDYDVIRDGSVIAVLSPSLIVRVNPESRALDRGASETFSVSPGSRLELLQRRIESALKRDPEKRRELAKAAADKLEKLQFEWDSQRWTPSGDSVRPLVEKRSASELNKEQAVREAVRADELITEGMSKLSPSTLAALGAGTEKLEDRPLIHAMLGDHGKLVSKSTALRRYNEAQGYDGAPWIPPKWYAGPGQQGLTPDQMAQGLYESGLLREPSPDALWDALAREIQSVRSTNEGFKQASEAAKTIEKQARAQAKEELFEWRKEQDAMQSKDYSPKARLLRDLRTLDALLSVLPAEVRGKVGGFVKLATLGSDKARLEEINRRVDKMGTLVEKYLQAETSDAMRALIEKAKPSRDPGKQSRGKLGAEAHRYFDKVEAAMDLTKEQVEAEQAAIDAAYNSPTLTNEQAADLFEQQQILDTFGAFDKKSAADMDAALTAAQDVYDTGRNERRIIEEQRLAEVQAMADDVVAALGGVSDAGIQKNKKEASRIRSKLANASLDLKSFSEVLDALLGRDHPLAQKWTRAAREGFAKRNDDVRELRKRWKGALEEATGKRGVAARRLLWNMGQEQTITVDKEGRSTGGSVSVPISLIDSWKDGSADPAALGYSPQEAVKLISERDAMVADDRRKNLELDRSTRADGEKVPMTQAEGIFLTMLAAQEQYTDALSKDGYTPNVVASIEEQLTGPAKKLREFMRNEYRDGYGPLASIFERMYGVALPQIRNYAPAAFYHVGQERTRGPEEGGGLSSAGMRAGFLANRKQHTAAPRLENAFATFFGHASQTAHWKGLAEFVREFSGVIGRPEVKKAIESKHGEAMLRAVNQWVQNIEGNGIQKASGHLDGFVRALVGAQAHIALAFRLGTIIKQSSAILGAAYKMPLGEYAKGFAKLITGNLEVRKVYESETIQRRLESGYAPEVRAAMDDIWTAKPTRRAAILEAGMEFIGLTDAIFTTGSAAIAYDYHYRQALDSGMTAQAAEGQAMREVEDIVGKTAQPADVVDRSLFEARQNQFGRLMFMYASEARQKSSLVLTAWKNTLTGKASAEDIRTLVVSHLIAGPLLQAITAAWRDARDDDDKDWFDAEHWKPKDFLFAIVAGPLAGIPLVGDALSGFGNDGVFSRIGKAGHSLWQLGEQVFGAEKKRPDPESIENTVKKVTKVMQGLDAFTGVAGSVIEQAFTLGDNFLPDSEEEAARKDRMQRARDRKAARE
jgi:hypothetical protein